MSDIRCVKCGESYDAYGVNQGDMLPWEAKLFKLGAGCPCCEGESDGWEPQGISDLDNGDDDPMLRIIALESAQEGSAPKWKRPDDPIHWTCDGCGVQVITDIDSGELEYRVPFDAACRNWYSSHRFTSRGACPEKEPAHTFDHGFKACEFCLDRCTDCHAPISSQIEGDTYDEGMSFPQPGSYINAVCIDCLEKYCDECANHSSECTCEEEESEDEDAESEDA